MGRPPRTVRGHFLDHPRATCEACLRALPGMRGETHVASELRDLLDAGLLARDAGRCATCHKNGVVYRPAPL